MVRSLIGLVTLLGLGLAPGAPASAQLTSLKLLVPASPGGGWDQTARAMEQALRVDRLVSGAIRITNHGGAGGTIGLAGFARATGEGNCLLVMGLVMMGAILTSKSPVTLDTVTRRGGEIFAEGIPAPGDGAGADLTLPGRPRGRRRHRAARPSGPRARPPAPRGAGRAYTFTVRYEAVPSRWMSSSSEAPGCVESIARRRSSTLFTA